ncbi:GTP pyrophosphokinase [Desulfosalsimonas propionicica]|uniref:GTP pyrophosphokinase n=1 Tax=Desulfosalsimonas propionicica TaxID=332175 RepID=A0A7W0C717_9BACT|nr:bifunctional (p)ppGpp synthetase/guanosine-3',5'-bis(diphosphate) 3'-pyrophosphohydrolase [Desulfosalsimonas propionicica]MBA2880297.1 GTP pyrophosphokinase [Desulfosalsimonas propionicica]
MIRITDILDKLYDYYPDADVDIIDRAYIYSARVHAGQMRLSGEPYLSHPLEVASLLADMKLDPVSISAGLLHDVVEDTHATIDEIYHTFGNEVAHIVAGVTKISALPFSTDQQRHAENIRKMILAMADDIRVILIKLADRLHNIRTLHYHKKPEKQQSIAQETLDIYGPIAGRLGIYWLKNELEETAFYYANPEEYSRIDGLLKKNQEERAKYVATVKTLIKEKMSEAGISCRVQGRHKQYYSIYQKMVSQELDFEEVYDIIAFRIVVENVSQCYAALGQIHARWKPIPTKFKDYIAVPKPNMYQSLHTTVIGPYGERMEIQIRSEQMDHVANFGIAAHWSYKEGKTQEDINTKNTFAWIHNLVENQENFGNPEEFLENVRIDLFPDEVFVFTPNGDVRSLPKGATPVDFAYMIHTEVGSECTGAKVNGRLVPLQYELNTGDIVEILTTRGHQPSKDWLNFVKTVKAKSRIRHWIRKQEKERSLSLGRELCEKAFRKYKLNFSTLVKSREMEKVAEAFNFKSTEDLIANVGIGKITPLQIIRKLDPQFTEKKDSTLIDKIMGPRDRKQKEKTEGVSVHGLDDILIRFGKCCQPVPGDPITGYITHGAGVTIHRSGCVNALKLNPDRQIDVEWNTNDNGEFPVSLKITASDRMGLLAEISTEISKAAANIYDVRLENRGNKSIYGKFTIMVKDRGHLDSVISRLKKIQAVQEVKRL